MRGSYNRIVRRGRSALIPRDWVRIVVSGDGPGVPDHERDVLETGEEPALHHGSMIGLWHVFLAFTGADGSLDIADNVPRGTTVTISIPVTSRASERASTGTSESSHDDGTSRPKRILSFGWWELSKTK